MLTLGSLRTALETSDNGSSLIFATNDGPIGAGYHVTELKLADIRSIDCGARQSAWTEATLQLLDGHGGGHMTVGTFRGIADKSLGALPGLSHAPLSVEFAPGNNGLRLYQIEAVDNEDSATVVRLKDLTALCKPAHAVKSDGSSCCGPESAACC